jgi:hypothetical protein
VRRARRAFVSPSAGPAGEAMRLGRVGPIWNECHTEFPAQSCRCWQSRAICRAARLARRPCCAASCCRLWTVLGRCRPSAPPEANVRGCCSPRRLQGKLTKRNSGLGGGGETPRPPLEQSGSRPDGGGGRHRPAASRGKPAGVVPILLPCAFVRLAPILAVLHFSYENQISFLKYFDGVRDR